MKNKSKDIINFLAEAGQLKRVKRSGWWVVGIKDPESVAEHCFRTAIIGYLLAKKENVDPYEVLLIALFHDTHEARTNDLHKIGLKYFDFKPIEKKIAHEQLSLTDNNVQKELSAILSAYSLQKSKAAIIARDADILECILQGKEYLDQGMTQAKSFLSAGKKYLKTKSAKLLYQQILKWNYKNWWLHLTKFTR